MTPEPSQQVCGGRESERQNGLANDDLPRSDVQAGNEPDDRGKACEQRDGLDQIMSDVVPRQRSKLSVNSVRHGTPIAPMRSSLPVWSKVGMIQKTIALVVTVQAYPSDDISRKGRECVVKADDLALQLPETGLEL